MPWLLTRAQHPRSRRGGRRPRAGLPRRAEHAPLMRVLRAAPLPAAPRPPQSRAPPGAPAACSARALWGPGRQASRKATVYHDQPERAAFPQSPKVSACIQTRPLCWVSLLSHPRPLPGVLPPSSLRQHVPRQVHEARTRAHPDPPGFFAESSPARCNLKTVFIKI